jgi:hypothetical protein
MVLGLVKRIASTTCNAKWELCPDNNAKFAANGLGVAFASPLNPDSLRQGRLSAADEFAAINGRIRRRTRSAKGERRKAMMQSEVDFASRRVILAPGSRFATSFLK